MGGSCSGTPRGDIVVAENLEVVRPRIFPFRLRHLTLISQSGLDLVDEPLCRALQAVRQLLSRDRPMRENLIITGGSEHRESMIE